MTRLLESHMGRTRNLLLWRDDQNRLWVETVWKPQGIRLNEQEMPRRRFALPCHVLCGLDLRRPHLTCVASCRIRRVYYHKLPDLNELERVQVVQIRILKRRRFPRLKDFLMKEAFSLIHNFLAN
jgi:hypothetical protein